MRSIVGATTPRTSRLTGDGKREPKSHNPDIYWMKKHRKQETHRVTVGWREWLALPELGIPAIKAKLDTGARTSALHTFAIETFHSHGRPKVRFGIHPLQKRRDIELFCVADVVDRRVVSDSGGHRELRYVISTSVQLGNTVWPVEITLTNRDTMLFRMLIGRSAMRDRLIVDPDNSYLTGRSLAQSYSKAGKSWRKT